MSRLFYAAVANCSDFYTDRWSYRRHRRRNIIAYLIGGSIKYFIDSEFIDNGHTIDLLSIGIVAEDGRPFYQCNRDAGLNKACEWVIWNVYPHLPLAHSESGWHWTQADSREPGAAYPADATVVAHWEIRNRVKAFVGADPNPAFYLYYGSYDWVAICQLFGRMMDLPATFPKFYFDVKQYAVSLGSPVLPKQASIEHHALNDAQWTREAYEFLRTIEMEKAK